MCRESPAMGKKFNPPQVNVIANARISQVGSYITVSTAFAKKGVEMAKITQTSLIQYTNFPRSSEGQNKK